MKKMICMFLAFLICIMFSACGSDDISTESNGSKVDSIIDSNSKEKFNGEKKFMEEVIGTWSFCGDSKNTTGINTIEIFENYTLKFDKKQYEWDFHSSINADSQKEYDRLDLNKIEIDVFENNELCNQFKISKFYEEDQYHFLSFGANQIYTNNNDFTIIDITLDNYEEYFELNDYFVPIKDKFGDFVGSFDFSRQLTVKENIKVFDRYSTIEFKGTESSSIYGFEFNESNESYKLLELLTKFDEVYSFSEECIMRDDGVYAGLIGGQAYEVAPGMEYQNYKFVAEYPDRVTIDGIMGKLYICKWFFIMIV